MDIFFQIVLETVSPFHLIKHDMPALNFSPGPGLRRVTTAPTRLGGVETIASNKIRVGVVKMANIISGRSEGRMGADTL
jgi:hypothetical protein